MALKIVDKRNARKSLIVALKKGADPQLHSFTHVRCELARAKETRAD